MQMHLRMDRPVIDRKARDVKENLRDLPPVGDCPFVGSFASNSRMRNTSGGS